MKYLILDPARLTHLIKSEDQLKSFNAFLASMEEIPYQKNTHQLTAEEKKAIARNLLAQNIPLEIISQATGLSIEDIRLCLPHS